MAEIGIKLADGSFFTILNDTVPSRKRIILTPAQEHQSKVQVDLIRKDGDIIEHVGSLLLEDIPETDDHPSELDLVVGLGEAGNLDAQLATNDNSQYQSFAINLGDLAKSGGFDLPDFDSGIDGAEDMGDLDLPDFDLDSDDIDAGEFEQGVSDLPDDAEPEAEPEAEPRSFNVLTFVAVLLIVLSIIALATFGIFSLLEAEILPGLRSGLIGLLVPATAFAKQKNPR